MDFEAEFLLNPFSYILGTISLIGFLIVARNEIRLWFSPLFGKLQAARAKSAAHPLDKQNSSNIFQPARKNSILLGLILMGIVFSDVIFIMHVKAEQLEPVINLNNFLLIMFALTMLPGGLTGMAAIAWIQAAGRIHPGHLLGSLLAGMLIYLGFVTLVEFTEIHLLLFLCGPAITLLVYRFLPVES